MRDCYCRGGEGAQDAEALRADLAAAVARADAADAAGYAREAAKVAMTADEAERAMIASLTIGVLTELLDRWREREECPACEILTRCSRHRREPEEKKP